MGGTSVADAAKRSELSKVPSFALFEFLTSQSGDPPQANNAKGGSCVVEAPKRSGLVGGTCIVQAA
jgi:hypothetical protein